jgi:hypothetical protein
MTMLHIVALFVAAIVACVANILCFRVLLVLFSFTMLHIVALFVTAIFACFANMLRFGFYIVHCNDVERFIYNKNIKIYALSIFHIG